MKQRLENLTTNLHQPFDNVTKTLIDQNPEDWVELALGRRGFRRVKLIKTGQHTVKSNQADSFISVTIDGREVIVHLEIQTHDSRNPPMPRRIAGYVGRGIESFGLPIYSHVIYLHPRAGRTDPGEYIQEMPGYEVRIRYKVIRLSDLEGERFIETPLKGLVPFTPLMRPPTGMPAEDWLRQCVQAATAVPQDVNAQTDYLADLAILSGLVFEYQTIGDIISEETMHESSVIQHFLQQGMKQGLEQGETRAKRAAVLKLIESHFGSVPEPLARRINRMRSHARLDSLFDAALQADTLEDLQS